MKKCNNSVGENPKKTSPVGSYPTGAGPYGCLDMAGNVHQWCEDWFSRRYYAHSPQTDPTGPDSGERRILRGGALLSLAWSCRSSNRLSFDPSIRYVLAGFRCLRTP